MPAAQRPSALLLIAVGAVFLGGIGFGAVAALTQPRSPAVAKGTTPETTTDTEPTPDTKPAPTTKKTEPTRKAEPKPEPPKKGDPKPTKKADPPKKPDPKPEPPKTVALTYQKDVFPLFKTKCLLCHGDPQKKADLDLRTLATAMVGGDSGDKGVVAGKPEESSIWKEIDNGTMPKDPKERLTAAEKKLVKDWILGGAK